MKLRTIALSSALLLACNSDALETTNTSNLPDRVPTAANTVEGTFRSYGLDLKSTIIYPGDIYGGGRAYYLMLSDQPDICTLMKANAAARNATMLFLLLGATDASSKVATELPTATGTYTAKYMLSLPPNGLVAGGWFSKYDDNCVDLVADARTYSNYASADTSTITIDEIEAGVGAKGSFNFAFSTRDELRGRFEATACDTVLSTVAPACE